MKWRSRKCTGQRSSAVPVSTHARARSTMRPHTEQIGSGGPWLASFISIDRLRVDCNESGRTPPTRWWQAGLVQVMRALTVHTVGIYTVLHSTIGFLQLHTRGHWGMPLCAALSVPVQVTPYCYSYNGTTVNLPVCNDYGVLVLVTCTSALSIDSRCVAPSQRSVGNTAARLVPFKQ